MKQKHKLVTLFTALVSVIAALVIAFILSIINCSAEINHNNKYRRQHENDLRIKYSGCTIPLSGIDMTITDVRCHGGTTKIRCDVTVIAVRDYHFIPLDTFESKINCNNQ